MMNDYELEEFENNDIVQRLEGEDERDYSLFIDWICSNVSISRFHKKNNLDIGIRQLYKISSKNNWIHRRDLYRQYKQLEARSQNQYILDLSSTKSLENLIKLNNELSAEALIELDKLKNEPNKKETILNIKNIMTSLNESVRLSRLLADKSDNNLLIDSIISQNNMNNHDSNNLYKDYQSILDGEE